MTIHFTNDGAGYGLRFSYDADIVALIKVLPRDQRRYSPDSKEWAVRSDAVPKLAESFRAHGYAVTGLDEPSAPRITSSDPRLRQALALLTAVVSEIDAEDEAHTNLRTMLGAEPVTEDQPDF